MREIHKIISERVRFLCKEKNVSYYQLAYRSTVPMTTLSHIIEGSTKNSGISTIVKICDGLGVSLSEFFDTEEFSGLSKETEK